MWCDDDDEPGSRRQLNWHVAIDTVPKCRVVKMADSGVVRADIRSALSNRGGWKSLIAFFVLALAWLAGFSSRLFAVIRFESIIHEFDPWWVVVLPWDVMTCRAYLVQLCLPCVALPWGQPAWQGLGFSGLVHEETHPYGSNFIQSVFKTIQTRCIDSVLIQIVPFVNNTIWKKNTF